MVLLYSGSSPESHEVLPLAIAGLSHATTEKQKNLFTPKKKKSQNDHKVTHFTPYI